MLPIVLLAGVASAAGQTPAPARPAPATPVRGTPAPAAPAQAETAPAAGGFSYDPAGRRDPFVSMIRRGADPQRQPTARAPGLAGLETAEVTLKGTVAGREGFVAILQGSDKKTYIVREGERLADGTVRTITQSSMVIVQQVNDPLSRDTQREVRKMLHQIEEAK